MTDFEEIQFPTDISYWAVLPFHRKQTAMLKKEHTEIEDKLDRLLDLMMDSSITKEEFEAKKRKLKDRQYDIGELIKSLDEAEDTFTKRLICLINLANGGWRSSKVLT